MCRYLIPSTTFAGASRVRTLNNSARESEPQSYFGAPPRYGLVETGLEARSVLVPASVFSLANLADRRRQGVVHAVMHWLQSPQICKHCLEVVIGHIPQDGPGHDRFQ